MLDKMARMHSRKKGKSGSVKPVKKTKPSWVNYKPKEVEQLVVKLAKSEKSPSQIGIILRDVYGIPSVKSVTKKSILKILTENKLAPKLPENLTALIKKHVKLMKHYENNKHDKTSLRGMQLTESKIKRLIKHYKRTKKLPQNWIYEKRKAKLLIE